MIILIKVMILMHMYMVHENTHDAVADAEFKCQFVWINMIKELKVNARAPHCDRRTQRKAEHPGHIFSFCAFVHFHV